MALSRSARNRIDVGRSFGPSVASLRLAKLARGNAFKFANVCPQRCVVDAAHRSPRHEYVRPTRLQPLDAADKGAHDPWRTRHVANDYSADAVALQRPNELAFLKAQLN